MKKVLVCAVMAMVFIAQAYGQNCDTFYPLKKGYQFEMTEYNASRNVTGKSVTKVLEVRGSGNSIEADMQSDHFDAKGNAAKPVKYTIKCDGKTLFIDLQSLMQDAGKKDKGMEDMEMKADGSFFEIPTQGFQIGQTLKDAAMTIHMSQKGQEMGTMTMKVHRKIEGKESVTVPAGTFECYKISMEMENTMDMMGMKMPMGKTQTMEWFAVGSGTIKSETSREGKVIRMAELSKITRQ